MERVPGDLPHFNFGIEEVIILMVAFVLVFLLLGSIDLLAKNATTRSSGLVRLWVVLALIAALPFWGTLIYLLLASFGGNSEALWTIAPWLLTFAATRFGGLFLACAVICGLVYAVAKGGHREKYEIMRAVMGILVAGVLICTPIMLYKSFH
jgi:hypothetical protein